MKQIAMNCRFVERDFFLQRIKDSCEYITLEMAENIVNQIKGRWNDLTIKFFNDNSCSIYCNNSDTYLNPSDLSGACYDFYVKKRLEYIKNHLKQTA